MVEWLFASIFPIAATALLKLAELIPYVGGFVQLIEPLIAFYLFVFIGISFGEKLRESKSLGTSFLFTCIIGVCTLTFAAPYIVGYYTYPIKLAQQVTKETRQDATYAQASSVIKDLLNKEVGSDGIVSYAIYIERRQLSSRNLSEYAGQQFEEIDDLGGVIAAIVNVILHAIPLLLKSILCTQLGWVSEAGLIGIIFWYLFSLLLSFLGWKTAQ